MAIKICANIHDVMLMYQENTNLAHGQSDLEINLRDLRKILAMRDGDDLYVHDYSSGDEIIRKATSKECEKIFDGAEHDLSNLEKVLKNNKKRVS